MAPNLLIHEKSPYLLQHAHNPVDWRPWNQAAFDLAQTGAKPIFLSIGYASCHWCHVMEKDSFEDAGMAALLNDAFVCIKVDREERPDIDAIYMAACQMLNRTGGWPLTAFLTPDGKPFYVATFIPRESRLGQTGLMELCRRIQELWADEREKITGAAEQIAAGLKAAFIFKSGTAPDAASLDTAFNHLVQNYDSVFGGFSPAPKFPTVSRLLFLLRFFRSTGNPMALEMVVRTLRAMRTGGIWDHVGFGFHRYSVDEKWLTPHFEKMLYDQALAAMAYLEAWQCARIELFSQTAEEIFAYALRDLRSEEGAFYSAEDADSEGREGTFYLWRLEEFEKIFSSNEADLWKSAFGLSRPGNFTDEVSGRQTGANILRLSAPLDELAGDFGMSAEVMEKRWRQARKILFALREKRVRPFRDEKILADWNGLMAAVLAAGGRILDRPSHVVSARKTAFFLINQMGDGKGGLYHRYFHGHAAVEGFADDYAFLILALLELYRATLNPDYGILAEDFQIKMVDRFWDAQRGGFFTTAHDDGIVRPKILYGGAVPSANAAAYANLLRLARLTQNPKWEQKAGEMAAAFGPSVCSSPEAYADFLAGVDFAVNPGAQGILICPAHTAEVAALLKSLNAVYSPNSTIWLKTLENADALGRMADFTQGFSCGQALESRLCGPDGQWNPVLPDQWIAAFAQSSFV